MSDYNPIPHIHHSASGKRYCEQCGQPLIEHQLKIEPHYSGDLRLPDLRGRSNVISPFVSEGVVSRTINLTTTGVIFSTPLLRDQDVEIGQLPKGSVRAHIEIRDVAVNIVPNGSIVTPATLTAFLHYMDISGRLHVILPIGFTSLSSIQSQNVWADTLIVNSPVTDGAPPNFGFFAVEVVTLALGTETSIDVILRANLAIQYEV